MDKRIFSQRSRRNLERVHPDLVRCVQLALGYSEVDFTVVEGARTLEKQREYVSKGASRTMKSYHLIQPDGYAHAVDLYPWVDGSVRVNAPFATFRKIADGMKRAARELGIRITWGGDWKTFVDAPHYQIEVG